MKKLPPLRYPLFTIGLGLFLTVMAVEVTDNLFTLWIGGLMVGQGSVQVANAFDRMPRAKR